MAVNIGQDNAGDAFYRYKMPKLQARIEGRGNGIKTNVVNNVEIAKALERPPDYIVKFFGCELGAQTKYDKALGTSIVNGAHETGRLVELLEGFIKKYVQCYACGNPETTVKIKKDAIHLKCKACGQVSDVDMRHKLNTYILKNPPEEKISKAEKKLKKMEKEKLKEAAGDNLDKEEKKKKKKDKDSKKKKRGEGEDNGEGGSNEDDDEAEDEADEGDDVVWMTDTSEEAARKRAAEQLTGATAAMVTQGNIEAEQEAARKREEKAAREEAARRKAEQEAEAAKAAAAAEEARLAEEAAQKLALENAAQGVTDVQSLRAYIASHSPKDTALELRKMEVEGGPVVRMRMLYEALFGDSDARIAPQIAAKKSHLIINGADDIAKVAQLLALEYLVGVACPAKLSETSVVLKALYDEDIVEESHIMGWFDKPGAGRVLGIPPEVAKAVRQAAQPLVDWLRSAESDGDSDAESGEESEEE